MQNLNDSNQKEITKCKKKGEKHITDILRYRVEILD